jgi:hypothetical protein
VNTYRAYLLPWNTRGWGGPWPPRHPFAVH